MILTGKHEQPGESLVALAPDGRTVAIATGADITLYSALTGQLEQTFHDVHTRKSSHFIILQLLCICEIQPRNMPITYLSRELS